MSSLSRLGEPSTMPIALPNAVQQYAAFPDAVPEQVALHRGGFGDDSAADIALRVRSLKKSFGGNTVLGDVSVDLHEGEIVLLRGDNGAGKTTLLNILTGNLNADFGTIETSVNRRREKFCFPASWWKNLNPFNHFTPERLSKEGIGRMWQDVRLFNSLSLSDNITVAAQGQIGENPAWALARGHSWPRQEKQTQQEAAAMLNKLGLTELSEASADKISLGQSKRVAIARAVQAGAKILFLDEPLSGLDAQGLNEVMALLRELSASGKVTLVIVEHVFNIPHILNIATTVWTLVGGSLLKEDPAAVQAKLQRSNDSEFQDLLTRFAGPVGNILERRLGSQARLTTIIPGLAAAFLPSATSDESCVNDRTVVSGTSRGSTGAAVAGASVPALEVRDLVVYRGKRLIIGEIADDGKAKGISFKLYKGQVSVLHAPNGWGKSTLLEAIAGLLPISSGQILIDGKCVEALPAWQRAKLRLSLLRSRDNYFQSLTVRDTLMLSGIAKVPEFLCPFADKRICELSGGERQRVLAVSTLSKESFDVALLDEPFSALDPSRVQELSSLMLDKMHQAALLIAVPASLETIQ